MRLLYIDDHGAFSLVERTGTNIPPYAILSHVWGSKDDEVTYNDLITNMGKEKAGYRKLTFCAQQAAEDNLRYFWIDTCCIDKSSSAELSEAITSMFRWYNASAQCYVYLPDVSADKRKADYESYAFTWEPAFRTSKWFTRGWTLQELLAPRIVKFFSKEGKLLGDKLNLEQQIHEVTQLPIPALRGAPMANYPIQERMNWIANRQTTREEDGAYSLLGIFGVSMAPLYGEGKEIAFKRLQREIADTSNNRTVSLDEEQKRMLMDSLRFDQIDARHLTIKNAYARTCKWLLSTSTYHEWLDPTKLEDHHGFLWIKGKPGTGKSTLMKFALANARKTMKDKVVIAYFFNARGEHLEKSTVGTYRSLLLQLLEQLPALHGIFESCALSARSINVDHQWSNEALQALLEQAIQNLGSSHVVCFIDALDECEERQIRSMISFFERIGQLTISSGIRFQVCFSSRHYPEITINKGMSLVLEGQEGHTQDITNYLESELKIGKSKVAQQIRSDLQDKASGVFMWVVLVVDILNQEFDRGRMHALKRRLQEIPADLHELFRDILTRDSRNKDELILCIQWVLFARQPMSPEQLYFAILSGSEPDAVTKWDPEETTKDAIRRFLLDSSKGLTEITKTKAQKVQFIHESVRDFLLKDDGLGNIWPDLQHNFEGQSHDRLKQCCLNHVNLDLDFEHVFLSSDYLDQEVTELRGLATAVATASYPYLEYAVQNVLYHADAAEGTGLSQEKFMLDFPRIRWIRLDNLFEKHRIRRHNSTMSILYLLAERNLPNLIKASPSARYLLTVEDERYGTPFFAALATGSKEAVCAFANAFQADDHQKGCIQETYVRYSQDRNGQSLFKRDFKYRKNEDIAQWLMDLKNPAILALAIEANVIDVNTVFDGCSTRLILAANRGDKDTVELLLSSDKIDVERRDDMMKTPLILAAQSGHKEVVKLLLGTGKVDVNAKDDCGSTALIRAARYGHKDIVELLLATGEVEVNAKDTDECTTLMWAAQNGLKDIVELLLRDTNVEVNKKDILGRTGLICAAGFGHKDIVNLLLTTGKVEINTQDSRGLTALIWAAQTGHKDVVKLLLNIENVDVDAKDRYESTALIGAVQGGHRDIVKLLLNTNNIEVNSKDNSRDTALMCAARLGHRDIVELLLNTGKVEVDATDIFGLTALMCAQRNGHKDIVELLWPYLEQS